MIIAYTFLPNILLRVTPTAKRNTYSVATPYYIYTQGRGAARLNPGLGNRNSYRVAAGCGLYPHWATCILLNYSNPHLRPHHHTHAYTYPQLHSHHHPLTCTKHTPTPAPSYPHLHLPTPPPTPSSPRLRQHTPTHAPSRPHLLQPTPTPAPSHPCLHLPTTPPTPSSPRLHHAAWGNWTALFLQKWG